MIKVCCLGSGSSGNAIFVQVDQHQMLVDAGFSKRELGKRLTDINKSLDDIEAIFITHDHGDHKSAWVYEDNRAKQFMVNREVSVIPFPLSHDAHCCGYTIEDVAGNKVGVVTDTGFVPEDAIGYLFDCNAILIETSYDVNLLVNGRYPTELQERIASDDGHLRNECAAEVVAQVSWPGLQYVVCLHLSAANNNKMLAEYAIKSVADDGTLVVVSEQHRCSKMLTII